MLSSLEFIQRLAARVPRPRPHLIRYNGVLAPNATLRARVVTQGPAARVPAAGEAAGDIRGDAQPEQARAQFIGWAQLLERMFDIDLRRCPSCGATELKIISAILQRAAIENLLTHLGWPPGRHPGDGEAGRGTRATRSPPAEKHAQSAARAMGGRASAAAGLATARRVHRQARARDPGQDRDPPRLAARLRSHQRASDRAPSSRAAPSMALAAPAASLARAISIVSYPRSPPALPRWPGCARPAPRVA